MLQKIFYTLLYALFGFLIVVLGSLAVLALGMFFLLAFCGESQRCLWLQPVYYTLGGAVILFYAFQGYKKGKEKYAKDLAEFGQLPPVGLIFFAMYSLVGLGALSVGLGFIVLLPFIFILPLFVVSPVAGILVSALLWAISVDYLYKRRLRKNKNKNLV